MFRSALFLITVFAFPNLFGQQRVVVKDLSNEWKIFEDGAMSAHPSEINETIHFTLELNQYGGKYLLLNSGRTYHVFINGKMILSALGGRLLPIDSLKSVFYSSEIHIAIHQEAFNPRGFSSQIVEWKMPDVTAVVPNPSSYFRDFVAAAGLILIIIFVALLRTNSKLSSDYFSVGRILSLRDSDDNPAHSRVAISSNVGFYLFASLLLGYFLLIVFTMLPHAFQIALPFEHSTFIQVAGQWLGLSVLLLSLFIVKLVVIFSLASLFGIRPLAGTHFFNWIRLILVLTSILSVVAFAFFINRKYESDLYVTLLTILASFFTVWIILAFFKLANRSQHTMFHLFSYICATEVIPLIITIKVLFR
ncbi:MAG TPA: DUF4271 domain-containing protein [Chryseosolibacter sp.]|nr:DUF4271 domain-containing protein [Chryseosolibacter sp.]